MRLTKVFIIFSLLMILFACSKDETKIDNNSDSSGDGDTIKLRVAAMLPNDDPSTQDLEEFVEKVKEKTDGRIEMQVYPNNQLGDYSLMYKEIGSGSVDLGLISIPTQIDPRLVISNVPYLFQTYESAIDSYKPGSELVEILSDIHLENNIQLLGFHPAGFGGIGTVKEIKDPLDFNTDTGLSIRVPEWPEHQKNAEILGFRTLSMPFEDIFTSMQTGQVDGWIGGHPESNFNLFNDTIKYYYDYRLYFETTKLLIGNDLWERLSEEDSDIITDAAEEMTNESFSNIEDRSEQAFINMEESGINVIKFDDKEMEEMAELSKEQVWPLIKEELGDELYERMLEIADEK